MALTNKTNYMKREIKFRAWHREAKQMLTGSNRSVFSWQEDGQPVEIMQFTGLHDKNGTEIYEGDVIKNSNKPLFTLPEDPRTYVVQFKDGAYNKENTWLQYKPGFIFKKIQPKGVKYMELIFSQSQIEIIGNIHENPELLK